MEVVEVAKKTKMPLGEGRPMSGGGKKMKLKAGDSTRRRATKRTRLRLASMSCLEMSRFQRRRKVLKMMMEVERWSRELGCGFWLLKKRSTT